jgi:hypothetical protein
MRDVRIERIDVQACRIPSDHPEADGTLAWDFDDHRDRASLGGRRAGSRLHLPRASRPARPAESKVDA